MTEPSTTQRDEPTPEKILMDWMDENGVELHGATPAMLVSVLRSTGYRKPRTITTVEELDALPVGSVILDTDAYVGRKERVKSTADWSVTLHKYSKQGAAFSLPATVLHEPEAEATR